MHEMIITLVGLDTVDGVTYPTTNVYRFEFETLRDALNAIASVQRHCLEGGELVGVNIEE